MCTAEGWTLEIRVDLLPGTESSVGTWTLLITILSYGK